MTDPFFVGLVAIVLLWGAVWAAIIAAAAFRRRGPVVRGRVVHKERRRSAGWDQLTMIEGHPHWIPHTPADRWFLYVDGTTADGDRATDRVEVAADAWPGWAIGDAWPR